MVAVELADGTAEWNLQRPVLRVAKFQEYCEAADVAVACADREVLASWKR